MCAAFIWLEIRDQLRLLVITLVTFRVLKYSVILTGREKLMAFEVRYYSMELRGSYFVHPWGYVAGVFAVNRLEPEPVRIGGRWSGLCTLQRACWRRYCTVIGQHWVMMFLTAMVSGVMASATGWWPPIIRRSATCCVEDSLGVISEDRYPLMISEWQKTLILIWGGGLRSVLKHFIVPDEQLDLKHWLVVKSVNVYFPRCNEYII